MHHASRLLLAVLFVLATVAATGLAADAPRRARFIERLEAGQPQAIVVYGTSLTAGGAWVPQIRDWLDARYPGLATVVNGGNSGKASKTGLANLQDKVLARNPDAVFIEFATNDAFTAYKPGDPDRGISVDDAKANLNTMIDRILAQHPDGEIILQTMNPAWDAPNGNGSASKRPKLAEYFQAYRDVAKQRGLLLIDHEPAWQRLQRDDREAFERYIPDGVHPNAEGYAAVVTPVITRALLGEPSAAGE